MDPRGATAVVTGAASGIGRALAIALRQAGASSVVVADIDAEGARRTAQEIGGAAMACDVASPEAVARLIETVETEIGAIGLFCSNAGIATGFDNSFGNAAGADNAVWQRAWTVNVMAHVVAARSLVPRFKARGGGYFLQTVSAAGLLSQLGSAVYATTKHAAIGFAENLAITHRRDNIRVSVLCPQGVDTPMLHGLTPGPQALDGVLSPTAVAAAALDGISAERFLILPHPKVADYVTRKAADYDRWIVGMARLQDRVATGEAGEAP